MRRPFGGSAATVLVDQTGINGGAVVHVWPSETGGTELTDLQEMDGTPIPAGGLTADDNGKVRQFLGPDDGSSVLWFDAGLGRYLVESNDTVDRVLNLEQRVTTLSDQLASGAGGGGTGGGTTGGDVDDGTL